MTLAHRPADARDRHFICHSWTKSYRDADSAGFVQVADWYRLMYEQAGKALDRPGVVATVAYETTDVDRVADLYGYIVADVTEVPPLVYYVFVKENFRREGIARGLFAAIGVDPLQPFHYVCSGENTTTHESLGRWLALKRKIPMARWMPRLGRFPKSERRRTA